MAKRFAVIALICAGMLLSGVASVRAATPLINASWATEVVSSSARLHAEIDPNGAKTNFQFEYITQVAYGRNRDEGKEGFTGAGKAPPSLKEGSAGLSPGKFDRQLKPLKAETAYRYRVFADNSFGFILGPERTFTTPGFGAPLELLDQRGWEMVSPVDKNGGEIQGFDANSGGGVLQAAAQGDAVTFSSASSFGQGGQGAPVASQYVSGRSPGGWVTENVTAPLFAGGYGENPNGVPYQLFSTDLSRGLLSGLPYPPLAGTGAPSGYENYYLRDGLGGGFEALLTPADISSLTLSPRSFELGFAGASPDLSYLVLSTCAALTANATEVPDGPGSCDAGSSNLYEWSSAAGLRLVNLPLGASTGEPGARLAASNGAISSDGSRIYWTGADGNLYLRENGASTFRVDQTDGGNTIFQAATPDGSVAFFIKDEHLYRYEVGGEPAIDLTPGGEVQGMLGASEDGSYVYYLAAAGLFLAHGGTATPVAPAADLSNVPPSTGTARVTLDGAHLAFLSSSELTGYDNIDQNTHKAVSEVYLYDANTDTLTCASCNPTGERPSGPSSIPGAVANGQDVGATRAYRPRALSADGRRLFFDSDDALVLQDKNVDPDVYEWEAEGAGSCRNPGGCVQLISRGSGDAVGASFVDASADGADVFFLTDGSLLPTDPGSLDLYDAREGGGFPQPQPPFPCEGDSCQPLPPPPDDPTPGTLVPNGGNPAPHFRKPGRKSKHKKRHNQRRRHR